MLNDTICSSLFIIPYTPYPFPADSSGSPACQYRPANHAAVQAVFFDIPQSAFLWFYDLPFGCRKQSFRLPPSHILQPGDFLQFLFQYSFMLSVSVQVLSVKICTDGNPAAVVLAHVLSYDIFIQSGDLSVCHVKFLLSFVFLLCLSRNSSATSKREQYRHPRNSSREHPHPLHK